MGLDRFVKFYASLSFSEHVTVGAGAIVLLMVLSVAVFSGPETSLTDLVLAFFIMLVSLVSLVCVCYLVVRQLVRMRRPQWPAVFAFVAGTVGALPVGSVLLAVLTR